MFQEIRRRHELGSEDNKLVAKAVQVSNLLLTCTFVTHVLVALDVVERCNLSSIALAAVHAAIRLSNKCELLPDVCIYIDDINKVILMLIE